MTPAIHPIESESYRILERLIDLTGLDDGQAAVVSRIVHASADPELAGTVVVDRTAVPAGIAALRAGAPVVCDVQMVRAGITAVDTHCLLDQVTAGPDGFPTRSANAMALAAERWPEGAVFVIGCAPTALFEVVRLVGLDRLHPALVIGLPVGFVGAAESKDELRALASSMPGGRTVPTISNHGVRGGSAVAAAALNALVRLAASSSSSAKHV